MDFTASVAKASYDIELNAVIDQGYDSLLLSFSLIDLLFSNGYFRDRVRDPVAFYQLEISILRIIADNAVHGTALY